MGTVKATISLQDATRLAERLNQHGSPRRAWQLEDPIADVLTAAKRLVDAADHFNGVLFALDERDEEQ